MEKYINLLKRLISTPSYSKEESDAANIFRIFLTNSGINFETDNNNTWARNKFWKVGLPVILLNSHIDTVKPASAYTRDPFLAEIIDGKLFGLGSNDAGGALVCLLATFIYFNEFNKLPFNLVIAATAEEEISGANGLASILKKIGHVDLAIVGEPTKMEMAVAEKGLIVLDCIAHGKSGHAARNEGENAIYKAITDICLLNNFIFEKESDILGKVKLSVTMINAGSQHNVVPDRCAYVVDVRTNEFYTNQEIFETIKSLVSSEVIPRSFRLNSSSININHPIVKKGQKIGLSYYGSPTTSDQAVLNCNSIKIGPGDSARSHTADEFIFVSELYEGFAIYKKLLDSLVI